MRARSSRLCRWSVFSTSSPGAFPHLLAGFRQGLKDAGVIEGQNATIEYRWAEGRYDRLPALAAELVGQLFPCAWRLEAKTPAVAAEAATRTIPIVFLVARDPALTGLVASLSRPGGNATGVNLYGAELGAKRLGLLHDLVPTASVIGLLINPGYLTAEAEVREVEAAARRIGCEILLLKASNDSEIDAAFAAMRARTGALLVGTDPFFNSRRQRIVALAGRDAVPVMFDQRNSPQPAA